jgi:hypothetical protein
VGGKGSGGVVTLSIDKGLVVAIDGDAAASFKDLAKPGPGLGEHANKEQENRTQREKKTSHG